MPFIRRRRSHTDHPPSPPPPPPPPPPRPRISYFPPHVLRARIPTPPRPPPSTSSAHSHSLIPADQSTTSLSHDFSLARARFFGARKPQLRQSSHSSPPRPRRHRRRSLLAALPFSASSLHLKSSLDKVLSQTQSPADPPSCPVLPTSSLNYNLDQDLDEDQVEDDFDTEEAIARITQVIRDSAAEISVREAAANTPSPAEHPSGLWRRLSQLASPVSPSAAVDTTNTPATSATAAAATSDPSDTHSDSAKPLHIHLPSASSVIAAANQTSALVTIPLAESATDCSHSSSISRANSKNLYLSPVNANTLCDEDFSCIVPTELKLKKGGKRKSTTKKFFKNAAQSLRLRKRRDNTQISQPTDSKNTPPSPQPEPASTITSPLPSPLCKPIETPRTSKFYLSHFLRARLAALFTAQSRKEKKWTEEQFQARLRAFGEDTKVIKAEGKKSIADDEDSKQSAKRMIIDVAKMRAQDWDMISPGTQTTCVNTPSTPTAKPDPHMQQQQQQQLPSPGTVRFNNMIQVRSSSGHSVSGDKYLELGTAVVERPVLNPFSPAASSVSPLWMEG
ncbi:hypothetical protein BZA70DRAFT_286610 [Myxozyma melibiosi]|uniref:Uncharacterized protein n=1 Tax=Myxozyma melibiosi TaxID=54550 RepID=A0ABR1FBL7_9ASCO